MLFNKLFFNSLIFMKLNYRFKTIKSRSLCIIKNSVSPEKIPSEYWNKIMSVAMDLKRTSKKNNKKRLNLLESKHVTLLFIKPQARFQVAYTLACDLLGVRRTTYHDPNFENHPFPEDSGRVLSSLTDMFIVHGLHQDVLLNFIDVATVPVFPASSDVYCLQKGLSDMMTFQEILKNLEGISLAWIGPPNAIFNSYLVLSSKFGINVRYFLICSYGAGRMSPVRLYSKQYLKNTEQRIEMTEFKTVEETVEGAHIVATSMHSEENCKISLDVLKKAHPDCLFMHTLPRSWNEVSEDLINHEKNLSWKTSENYLYVAMAILLTSLGDHTSDPKVETYSGSSSSIKCDS